MRIRITVMLTLLLFVASAALSITRAGAEHYSSAGYSIEGSN